MQNTKLYGHAYCQIALSNRGKDLSKAFCKHSDEIVEKSTGCSHTQYAVPFRAGLLRTVLGSMEPPAVLKKDGAALKRCHGTKAGKNVFYFELSDQSPRTLGNVRTLL